MAAPSKPLLTDLPKDHRFPQTTVRLTRDALAAYLEAVEDQNPLYLQRGLAPPLAAAALALGSLLERIDLPAGTLHTGQEVEARAGLPLDTDLTLNGRVAQRSERAGLVISVIEFDLTPQAAPEPALTGRSTVMVAGGGP